MQCAPHFILAPIAIQQLIRILTKLVISNIFDTLSGVWVRCITLESGHGSVQLLPTQLLTMRFLWIANEEAV